MNPGAVHSVKSMALILAAGRFANDSLEQQQDQEEVAALYPARAANPHNDELGALHNLRRLDFAATRLSRLC
jgi:hypothetical protein